MTNAEQLARKERPRFRKFHRELTEDVERIIRTSEDYYGGCPVLFGYKLRQMNRLKGEVSSLANFLEFYKETSSEAQVHVREAKRLLEKDLPPKEEIEWYQHTNEKFVAYASGAISAARDSHLHHMMPGQAPDPGEYVRERRKTALGKINEIMQEEPTPDNVKDLTNQLEEVHKKYLWRIPRRSSGFSNVSGNK
ncbi:MAG: hypothetical protein WCK90_02920 [archaeon]